MDEKIKTEVLSFTHKGRKVERKIAMPLSLTQAVVIMGEGYVYDRFLEGYRAHEKKQAIGAKKKDKRWLRIDLTELDEEQKLKLKRAAMEIGIRG